jgi:hypothetical protein
MLGLERVARLPAGNRGHLPTRGSERERREVNVASKWFTQGLHEVAIP